jgi:hypothetical protein
MTKPKIPFDQVSMEDVEHTSDQILELIENRFALSSEHRADLESGFYADLNNLLERFFNYPEYKGED